MIEVVIKEIKYIDDIQVNEDTVKTLLSQVHAGAVIGLVVAPTQDPEKQALIELCLKKNEHKAFIRKGLKISVEQRKEFFIIPAEWEEYHAFETNGRLSRQVAERMEYKPLAFQKTLPKAAPRVS
ncbi:MAG: hypothetical protein ABH834_05170 [Candidatus Altiarchaeota archaeon]